MKQPWQQQQEQMRRQQEIAASYQRRQKEIETNVQKARVNNVQQSAMDDKFAEVEAETARLKQDFASGRLSEEQFKTRLQELMVQDEQGTLWMVGIETLEWFRYDGANWLKDNPPGHGLVGTGQQLIQPVYKPRRLLGSIVFLFGLAVTFVIGNVVAEVIRKNVLPHGHSALVVILIPGIILSFFIARKVWRRK